MVLIKCCASAANAKLQSHDWCKQLCILKVLKGFPRDYQFYCKIALRNQTSPKPHSCSLRTAATPMLAMLCW